VVDSGKNTSNQPTTPVVQVQAAINSVASIEQIMASLAAYLEQLDTGDRAEAIRMMSRLATEPEKHAAVALAIEGMASAAFARAHQKVA